MDSFKVGHSRVWSSRREAHLQCVRDRLPQEEREPDNFPLLQEAPGERYEKYYMNYMLDKPIKYSTKFKERRNPAKRPNNGQKAK